MTDSAYLNNLIKQIHRLEWEHANSNDSNERLLIMEKELTPLYAALGKLYYVDLVTKPK